MNKKKGKNPSQVAFIPIGIALMVIGMNNNPGLIGAGVVFLIIGMSAVVRSRKAQAPDDEPMDDEPMDDEPKDDEPKDDEPTA